MGISQSNPSSSATIEKKIEVFLSFRGETRHGFTNNLYDALRDKSIETFMDDRLEKGEETGPNLLKTIRESKISVVIFSRDYASSKWCLRELVEIMECREKNGQTVIPVFYNIAVSDVRHQEGSFKDGFDQLEKKFHEKLAKHKAAWTEHVDSADVSKQSEASFDEQAKEFHKEMQNWRDALTKASHVTGWDSSVTRPESKVIDEIVKDISEKLMKAYKLSPCDFKGLFGFEKQFKQVMSLLSLHNTDVQIIGIWGMGGIGKTTIADEIFKQISDDEYCKCFVQNVRQRLEQCGGLVRKLQREVLSKVLNDQNIKLDGVTLPQCIKERLCQKKVFIVLDDVDDFLKLEELAAGLNRLGPGSRIIITTRSRDILHKCKVNDAYIYEVKGLSYQEALQLFCEYAFRQSTPTVDLLSLSHETLRAINGNPLGLKVAGSSLLGLNKLEWQSALSRLKKSPEIFEVLQISYNSLALEHKDIFLDIACFFVGEHEDYIANILGNCSYSLNVLSNRSLITISKNKIIQMHDLLQEMGKEIVYKEDLNNPGNRSRLWTQEDVLDTLKNGDGTNAIRGIFLNMSKMKKEDLSSQAFEKMKNLRFLKFYDSTFYEFLHGYTLYSSNVHFPNDISYLSNKLRSLNWLGYSLKALPSNFIPQNLVELNLRHCNIEKLWENNMHAPKLKWITLKACPYLLKVSDILDAPLLEETYIESCQSLLGLPSSYHVPSLTYLQLKNCKKLTRISNFLDVLLLEKIDIYKCENLLSLPSPVHHFNNLRELNVRDCKNIMSFPNNIPFPSLVSLDLFGCINLVRISDFLDAPLLMVINLCNCKSLLEFPPPAHHFNNLYELNLSGCENLQSFPNNIPFPSLVSLDLSGCINLARISDFLDAPSIMEINLCNCKSLLEFPQPAHHFNNLYELNLSGCENLQSFPNNIPFPSLVSLDLSGCINLARISDFLDAPLLVEINLCNCKSLLEFPPATHHFNNLYELNLSGCENLQSFPNNIPFPSLVSLDLSWCLTLARISDLLDAPLLERINLISCKSLLDFPPPVQHFNKLRELILNGCQRLQSLPSNIQFPSLIYLDLCGCINLIRISELLHAPLLKVINLHSCSTLLEFSSPIDQPFNNLCELNVRDCKNLQSFAKNINFRSLISLDLSGCHSLTEFPDLLDAPLLEKINLEDCSSLLYFPSPFQHFNNLCDLNLQNCKNLRSFPSNNIHFPSLICLDFNGCINLRKFPNISGNIESLYMRKIAIDEVPSSIENLPELVELDLAECTRLKHISISICKLKSLRKLNLRNCSALDCFPEIFDTMESLKILDLSGTAIKGLHHSIENLSGLDMLFLRECKNLDEVPSSIENLTKLVKLDLTECTSLKHISISICKLKALRELNLRNCSALECFPEILDTMGGLEILDLSGTKMKELHHSIENLSGLEMLFLRECKNLEMLPISIYNLTSLNILLLSGCSKLENLPENSVADLSNCGESATTKPPICRFSKCELCFTNCLNLNKTAIINLMELQINQHRDMTTKGCGTQFVDLKFFYPGSKVPGWFKHQTYGSSINIQMSGHDGVNGHLIGLAACAVIEFHDDGCDDEGYDESYDDEGYDDESYDDESCDDEGYDFEGLTINISYGHRCHCKDHSHRINFIIACFEDETLTDHVALWYSDASVLELCGSDCLNYLFEFFLSKSPMCRVKYCGVCPIYEKQDITLPNIANETCGAAYQHFGKTSVKDQGKIRKFSNEAETSGRFNEDVIEPHPKRTCG